MKKVTSNNNYPFLQGGGEMGELTRNHDWSQTSIGAPSEWPQSLQTTLGILLHSAFPMFLFWGNDLLCFYNDAFRPSLGTSGKHPALGKPGAEVWAEIWDFIGPLITQVMTTGEPVWFEDQLVPFYRNGQLENIYWTFSYSPAYGDRGDIYGVLVTCAETTRNVNTIKQLQISQRRFQNLVYNASIGILVLDGQDLNVEVVNQAYARLVGRHPDELMGKPLFSVLPETQESVRPVLDRVRATGEPEYVYDYRYSVLKNSGREEGFLNLIYQPFKEQDGSITGVMILCQEVNDQAAIRQQLEESELFSRNVFFNSPVAKVVFVGEQMEVRTINENMLEMLGKDTSIIGLPFQQALPELVSSSLLGQIRQVYATGETAYQPEEKLNLVRSGKPYTGYFNFIYKALRNTAGIIYGIMVTATESTEQVLARQKVEEAEARLRGAIELAELATWSMDVKTGIFTYSERFMKWLGFSEDTKSMDEAYNPLPDEFRQQVADAISAVIQPGSSGRYENEHPIINRQTGQIRLIHAQAQVFYDSAGQPAVLSGTAQDITEQRNIQLALEQQVQERTEELAAMNEELATTNEELAESNALLLRSNENLQQFAYIASHDLQEPLRKVQQFGDLLKTQYLTQLGEGANYLDRMQAAASRMSMLIKDLLTFSRISTQQDTTEAVSLQQVIHTVLTDLELRIQETGAQVTLGPLPTIQGDSSQLEQLFQNLLSNALKFLRPNISPVIRIDCQTIAMAHLPPTIKPTRIAPSYHRINVADNGIGFDDKYIDRIFQVFQRLHTRSEFSGTGVGLAICEKVATNHGGAITASSQPGLGSTFSVFLPISEA
ncbi:PAS domain-containing protein [Larkinella bovis]|uniref:histidine kinase n=1 Tax=Larkinella bovis TaxID=683041 RepID=A0ABW0IJP5_9BACT